MSHPGPTQFVRNKHQSQRSSGRWETCSLGHRILCLRIFSIQRKNQSTRSSANARRNKTLNRDAETSKETHDTWTYIQLLTNTHKKKKGLDCNQGKRKGRSQSQRGREKRKVNVSRQSNSIRHHISCLRISSGHENQSCRSSAKLFLPVLGFLR